MPFDPYSDAIAEAYTLVPTTDRILHTLELVHPSLTVSPPETQLDLGAIRVVRDYGTLLIPGDAETPDIRGHYLTLEGGGDPVLFVGCMFDMTPPDQADNP